MVDMTKTTTEKKLTPSDIRGVFLRSNLFQGSWNFERMQEKTHQSLKRRSFHHLNVETSFYHCYTGRKSLV